MSRGRRAEWDTPLMDRERGGVSRRDEQNEPMDETADARTSRVMLGLELIFRGLQTRDAR